MDVQIQTIILNTLQDLATAVIPIVGAYAVVFIKKHMTSKEIETAQTLVKIGVTYASTLDIPNSDKYATALKTAKDFASKYGIKYDDEKWNNLIEVIYKEYKKDSDLITTTSTTPSIQTEPSVDNSSLLHVSDATTITTVTTPSITISKEMLQPTFDAILNKAEQDAKTAIDKVTNNVQQIVNVTPVVEPVQEQVTPSTLAQ